MVVKIERVFELTDEDIQYLATMWQCEFEEVKEIIEDGDFDYDDLRYIATDIYYDYSQADRNHLHQA